MSSKLFIPVETIYKFNYFRHSKKLLTYVKIQKKIKSRLIQRAIDNKVRKALEKWVKDERYLLEMSPREAAEEMGIGVEQMSFYFKAYVGMEFRRWRKHLRIEKAKILMRQEPQLSFTAIGEYIGIPDRGNFRREFYEVCKEWPAQWKEHNTVSNLYIP